MAFNPRTINKELDFANLAKHNDNYADIKTELDAHDAHIAAQTAHGSTAAATPGAIMQRDSAGRAKVAAPAAADDIARKAEVDAVQGGLDTHEADVAAHLSAADRTKLDGIEPGAQPNQNAFAQVNNAVAASESDTLTIAGGTGITISTNPTTKTVTVTATGEATPGAHGSSHDPDGSDPIPELVALRSKFNALTAADIGAETPAGAQAKVDALAGAGNTKTVKQLDDEVTAHLADKVTKGELVTYAGDYGVTADGSTDDTQGMKDAIAGTPAGGTLLLPLGQIFITDELSITKPIKIIGSLSEDQGYTILKVNLDGKGESKVAIRINNQIHGCEFADFYIDHVGAEATHDGILLDGVAGDYPNFIWYTKLRGLYVRGFRNNFRFRNVVIADVVNCRSISATGDGFTQEGFATALNFRGCYAQDGANGSGFMLSDAYYSGFSGCCSDGNKYGYTLFDTLGGYVLNCGSEMCTRFAVFSRSSVTRVDGLTLVESGVDQGSIFWPTAVYVESGNCDIRGVVEERVTTGNTRLYTILFEQGASGAIETTGHELLDIYIPYDGSCAIDGQYLTQGTPTKIGWKAKDVGKVVYNQNAVEQGTTPNKYIIFGYRRMTTGDGNVLGTDWLPLRALTGN